MESITARFGEYNLKEIAKEFKATASRIIFAGPSKIFTQANREQQRELNHAVYFTTIESICWNRLAAWIKERLCLTLNVKLNPLSIHLQLRMK